MAHTLLGDSESVVRDIEAGRADFDAEHLSADLTAAELIASARAGND
jgi:hypothetical protein